jgi:hypothetical protein
MLSKTTKLKGGEIKETRLPIFLFPARPCPKKFVQAGLPDYVIQAGGQAGLFLISSSFSFTPERTGRHYIIHPSCIALLQTTPSLSGKI